MTLPRSAYEAWVNALRAWREDPRHDMSALPVLVVDSLPPSGFDRLLRHMTEAQQYVMDRWTERFLRDWRSAADEHSRARVLLDARLLLARRLQLAGHPGLPEVIRTELTNGVVRDVRQLQNELEQAVTRQDSVSRVDRVRTERALHMLRTNSLAAILEPGFPLDVLIAGRVEVAPPVRPVDPPPLSGGGDPQQLVRRRRAIIIDS